MNKMKFIAEIGINHNGSLEKAKELINMAHECGADYVKFQKRNPDICVPEEQKGKEKIVPWRKEPTTYLEYKKDIEFEEKEYNAIDKYCKKLGIKWTASPWDMDSAMFLTKYPLDLIKIPSAKITDLELLVFCAMNWQTLVISTGMSTETEIDKAVSMIEKTWKEHFSNSPTKLYIMHCNSSYPAKDDELNLNYILQLKEKYELRGHVIGLSGHHEGISPDIVAATLGAEIFERHITLSRSMWGTDQAASITRDQLYKLIRDLHKIDTWREDGVKKIYPSEVPIRAKLR